MFKTNRQTLKRSWRWKDFLFARQCAISAVPGSFQLRRVFSFAKLDRLAATPSTASHISVEIWQQPSTVSRTYLGIPLNFS